MPLNTSAIVSMRACVRVERDRKRDRHRMEVDLFLCTMVLNASALRSSVEERCRLIFIIIITIGNSAKEG